MKKYKYLIVIGLLIILFFTVKSRRVSKSTFEFMVLVKKNEIMESCNYLLEEKKKNKNSSFNDLLGEKSYNQLLIENGINICLDSEKLDKLVESYYVEYYKKNWKFIY